MPNNITDTSADILSNEYDSGRYYEIPYGDFVSLARSAVQSPHRMSGGVEIGYDPSDAFAALIEDRMEHDLGVMFDQVTGYSESRMTEYHDTNKRVMTRASGIDPDQIDRASAMSKLGDPSPLADIREMYMRFI